VVSISFPVIQNLFHNPHFSSSNFDVSWSCEVFTWAQGFVREEVKFELGTCNSRMDAGHHGAKLHLVVVIVRFFKDWEWSNL
jgi:hypothetical protein